MPSVEYSAKVNASPVERGGRVVERGVRLCPLMSESVPPRASQNSKHKTQRCASVRASCFQRIVSAGRVSVATERLSTGTIHVHRTRCVPSHNNNLDYTKESVFSVC